MRNQTKPSAARDGADALGVDGQRVVLLGRSAGGHLAPVAGYRADADALPGGVAGPGGQLGT